MSIARHQRLGAIQTCIGVALLVRPQAALNAFAAPDTRAARRIARILGTRLTVQGTTIGLSGSKAIIDAGGVVDAVHAASMLAVAARGGRWRRAAAASAVLAATAALASRHAAPEQHR